jgi:hypothetical protein
MGRTIPSFRIAAVLEEKEWKSFTKYLNNNDRKAFKEMFSMAMLYNSSCSYASIPIRIYPIMPIMMSIVFHHYKILKGLLDSNISYSLDKEDINNNNHNHFIILHKELKKWHSFSSILRKTNRELFNQMLQSSLSKYSNSINAKGEQFSTESLIMSLLFEQYKIKIKLF